MPRRTAAVATLSTLAVLLAGCASVPDGAVEAAAIACPEGSECYDPPRQPGEGGMFEIEAGDFYFGEPRGTFWAGDIEITIDNVAGGEHNIEVVGGGNEGSDGPPIALAAGGEQATGTVNLFPGTYVFFCSIPGHRASGMETTITIYATQAEAEEELGDAAQTPPSDQVIESEADDINDQEAPDDDTQEPSEQATIDPEVSQSDIDEQDELPDDPDDVN